MPKHEELEPELLEALMLDGPLPGASVRDKQSLVPSGGPQALVTLRTRHHALARLIAEGRPNLEAAYATGYSPSTVGGLLCDPAFKELVEFYKNQVVEKYLDMHAKLGMLGATAVEVLQDRLEESPNKFTNDDLRKIIETSVERVGSGQQSGAGNQVSISVNFIPPKEAEPKVLDLKVEEQ